MTQSDITAPGRRCPTRPELAGTDKALVNTSGTLMLAMAGVSGRAGTEDDRSPGGHRGDVENATLTLADRGVHSAVVRLSPFVHSDLDKHGFGRS